MIKITEELANKIINAPIKEIKSTIEYVDVSQLSESKRKETVKKILNKFKGD